MPNVLRRQEFDGRQHTTTALAEQAPRLEYGDDKFSQMTGRELISALDLKLMDVC